MSKVTTIQLERKVFTELKGAKEYPRQTYSALIENAIQAFKKLKERDQYDKFLHVVQKQKMKELWDNREDEAWENA